MLERLVNEMYAHGPSTRDVEDSFRVAVGDSQGPVDPLRSKHSEPRKAVGGLADLHHQRVACFLQQVVGEIGHLAAGDDLLAPGEPRVDVQQLLGRPAVHHRSTASRRMSSSSFGLRPP